MGFGVIRSCARCRRSDGTQTIVNPRQLMTNKEKQADKSGFETAFKRIVAASVDRFTSPFLPRFHRLN
jgi:hypothetical protein